MSPSKAPRRGSATPNVDEHIVAPETRYELLDGEVTYVPPADEPHGMRHSKLAALVEAHAGAELSVACDMLTRTSEIDDVAPDVSVFPSARDPRTGGRQIEQLAFEIVSTQSLSDEGHKAAKLVGRGARRVFAIDLERSRVLEWSSTLDAWQLLDPLDHITDPALAVPLPIQELSHAGKADETLSLALIAKRTRAIVAVIAAGEQKGFAAGKQEGFAAGKQAGFAAGKQAGFADGEQRGLHRSTTIAIQTLLSFIDARGIVLQNDERRRILDELDLSVLLRWTARVATSSTAAELFSEDGSAGRNP